MDKILLAHGGGGSRTGELIRRIFQRYLDDPQLLAMNDSARLPGQVFSTDSFVVKPLFFPGGDIGRLAVCGTVNDIAVMGAEPKYLSIAFIIEEGFAVVELEKILASIARTAKSCRVRIVCADTKVVEKGKADGIYINTSGIGRPIFDRPVNAERIRTGDGVIISGQIGLHGIAVLTGRGEFGLKTTVKSDVAPLWNMIRRCRRLDVPFMRDPTRGGVAQTLNELVGAKGFGVRILENLLPIPRKVAAVCDMLGFDPLHIANEGKVIMVVARRDIDRALKALRQDRLGKDSRLIGEIIDFYPGRVILATKAGSERIVMPPVGEILPRIC